LLRLVFKHIDQLAYAPVASGKVLASAGVATKHPARISDHQGADALFPGDVYDRLGRLVAYLGETASMSAF
jgi:hypothetical protein